MSATDQFFSGIGMFVFAAAVSVLFAVAVVNPIDSGHWAMDRFDMPRGSHVVVLRQDDAAEPLWICADGTSRAPRNCLSTAQILKLARKGR